MLIEMGRHTHCGQNHPLGVDPGLYKMEWAGCECHVTRYFKFPAALTCLK